MELARLPAMEPDSLWLNQGVKVNLLPVIEPREGIQ